jgi:hypothetical protein
VKAPNACPSAVLSFLVLGLLTASSAFRYQEAHAGESIAGSSIQGSTAWDIICLGGQSGEFRRWSQTGCSSIGAALVGKQCHSLNIKCDADERVQDIAISWKVTGNTKELTIPKTAGAVTSEDHYNRFFVASTGCGYGKSHVDCDLPWKPFDVPRDVTQTLAVARTFLVYDSRAAGKPLISMEKNKYEGTFYASEFELLGTGIPVPAEPMFAGSMGTGCAAGIECAEPPRTKERVQQTDLDVTSNYLMQSPLEPGHIVLMKNRNTAAVQPTNVVDFSLDENRT